MELRVANANGSCENGACDCVGNLGGALRFSPCPHHPRLLLLTCWGRKAGKGEVSIIFPLGSQTVLKFRVWRRCHLPSGSCRELKQLKEEK